LPGEWTGVAHEVQTYEVLDGQFAGTTGGNTLTFFSTDDGAIPELPPEPLGAPWQTTGLAALSADGMLVTLGSTEAPAQIGTATLAGGATATVAVINFVKGDLTIEGAGTQVKRSADTFGLMQHISTGDSTLRVLDGGLLESGLVLAVGFTPMEVLVSGTESKLDLACSGPTICAALGFVGLADFSTPSFGGGTATSATTVTAGGRINIEATDNLGAGFALYGSHVLRVDGANSEVHIRGTQNGTLPTVQTGISVEQTATLQVTNGGKVMVERANVGDGGVLAGWLLANEIDKAAAQIVVDGTGSLIDAKQFVIGERFLFDSDLQQWVEAGAGAASEAVIRNGGLVKAERILVGEMGVLKGSGGTLQGAVENRGTIMPGESPGILNIMGDYVQSASGLLVIEIGGTAQGTFDALNISGTATLGGTLRIKLVDGYTPGDIDSFDFLMANLFVGNFNSIELPSFGANKTFAIHLGPNGFQAAVTAVPLPAAGWLFAAAIGGLAFRKKNVGLPC